MSAALQRIVNATPLSAQTSLQPLDVGQLPANLAQALWRGTDIGQAGQAVVSSGFAGIK